MVVFLFRILLCAVVSTAASQKKGHWFGTRVCSLSEWIQFCSGYLQDLQLPPTNKPFGNSKLSECVCMCLSLRGSAINGVTLPSPYVSSDRLQQTPVTLCMIECCFPMMCRDFFFFEETCTKNGIKK